MTAALFEGLPLWLNVFLFAIVAGIVWLCGTRLARYADTIASRKRIGRAFMGLIFLAAATELPEVVTTISAAVQNNAALLLNNMFGGITLQTAMLAVADASAIHVSLTFYPRKATPVLEGAILILMLALLLSLTWFGDQALVWQVGFGVIVLAVLYVFSIVILRNYDERAVWNAVELPAELASAGATGIDHTALSDMRLYTYTGIAVLGILVTGILLVDLSEILARQSGLGSSFIGVTLLAASTSLPELSTTVSAVRLRAYTMAISNIFGSNLIMLALLLPADIFYRERVLLAEVDASAAFALVSGIIVTAIYVIGLLVRRRQLIFGMGYDSAAVLAVYGLSLYAFYILR